MFMYDSNFLENWKDVLSAVLQHAVIRNAPIFCDHCFLRIWIRYNGMPRNIGFVHNGMPVNYQIHANIF